MNDSTKYYIKIQFSDEYPWKFPKVYIVDKNYNTKGSYLSCLRNIKFSNSPKKCLCCDSLICGNNWSPTTNTINVMNEINGIFSKLNQNIVSASCRSVLRQKLGNKCEPFLSIAILDKYLY